MVRSAAALVVRIWSSNHIGGHGRPTTDRARGASLVEYALLLALIAVACIVAVDVLGGSASTNITDSGSAIVNG